MDLDKLEKLIPILSSHCVESFRLNDFEVRFFPKETEVSVKEPEPVLPPSAMPDINLDPYANMSAEQLALYSSNIGLHQDDEVS